MSIYLQDNSVVLDSGSIATSSDCCCGGVCCDCDGNCDDTVTQEDCESNGGQWFPTDTCDDNPCDTLITGACCDGIDCSIKTQACCENDGGTYQGDDTTCDPNPCITCPCNLGFLNPDDGLFYLTRISINTPITDCPPDKTWLRFSDGAWLNTDCSLSLWHAPDCFTHGTRTESFVSREMYLDDCSISTTHEDISISTYCNCTDDDAIFDPGSCGGVLKPNCPPLGCGCSDPPVEPQSNDCTTIVTTYMYEDQCIP